MAAQAQSLYHSNPWVHAAERTVSGRGGSIEWHLEDANDDEVSDSSTPVLRAIRDLLEKPQANVPNLGRIMTRRELWTLTLRHMGLCGTAFWYLDGVDALAGTPLGIIYLNPARMWPITDAVGNLTAWSLDGMIEDGGTRLELREVLPFYLDPPDNGHLGIGLVESVGTKAYLNSAADRYLSNVLDSGGRLAGLVSPKVNSTVNEDQWRQFLNDARQIADDPQSAKRLQAVRGPIDFVQTSATPQELAVTQVADMSRDDILAAWGVPGSQIGMAITRALNSGAAQSFEEAVLWQNAIGPRLTAFYETIQYRPPRSLRQARHHRRARAGHPVVRRRHAEVCPRPERRRPAPDPQRAKGHPRPAAAPGLGRRDGRAERHRHRPPDPGQRGRARRLRGAAAADHGQARPATCSWPDATG